MPEGTGMKFVTARRKCICRITARDVPPGLGAEDVAKECKEDPYCHTRLKELAQILGIAPERVISAMEKIEAKEKKKNR